MLRLAANLTTLFTELPMIDRFAAAAESGFTGVEILYPYDIAASDLARAATEAGMEFVSLNCPPPNWSGGERGFAAEPGREARFRTDFDRALRFAQALRARHIHVMSGDAHGDAAFDVMVQNLRWACARAPHASLTLKPISPKFRPGYFLSDFDIAQRVIEAVGSPNLGLQFDCFQVQHITGDVQGTWEKFGSLIRHVQISGFPEGQEPVDGIIDYGAFLATLERSRYQGWISGNYEPSTRTDLSLGWMDRNQSLPNNSA